MILDALQIVLFALAAVFAVLVLRDMVRAAIYAVTVGWDREDDPRDR